MKLKLELKGVIPAVLTPFKNDEVDYTTLGTYSDWLIQRGVHGLFPAGTNGEGALMSVAERKRVAETVVEAANKRVPVLVHTGSLSTRETIELTKHAQEIGADGAGVVAPFYFPYDDNSLEEHFSAVAEAVPDFPIFIYNIPGNAKNDVKPKVVANVAQRCSNVIGVKDSSKDLGRLQDYMATMGTTFTVIVGTDALTYPAMMMGAAGVVSAVANVFPEHVVSLYNAVLTGDYDKARVLQYFVNQLRDALKLGPYIAPYKKALEYRGLSLGEVRRPLRPMTGAEETAMRKVLTNLGVI